MIEKTILRVALIFACLLVFAGCDSQKKTTTQSSEVELVTYKQDMLTQALEHAQQMQLAAMSAQDENAILKARNEELTKQLDELKSEGGFGISEPLFEEPLDPDNLEQKYLKLQKDNDELKKRVQYEILLREDLMKKIEQDQITIRELKSRLGE